jgi:molecular chaperone GrpE (heat shock protein)
MREHAEFNMVKWPFLLGDAFLLLTAYLIYRQSTGPMVFWQAGLTVVCVAAGAGLIITPFLLESRVVAKLSELSRLITTVEQVGKLESVIAQFTASTAQCQSVQEEVCKTAVAAKGIAEQISAEVQNFTQVVRPINDSEKAKLRLEVEELRRLEGDCLQVLVQVLDHVYSLYVGALRSGQPNLIEQVSNFQDACRKAARRMGLMPFIAEPAERFDAQRHQVVDSEGSMPTQGSVAETIATGYTFKGRLLRPASVRLEKSNGTDQDHEKSL